MRLEILVGSDEPQIFALNRPKILIGSFEGCDIVLNAPGVSRKHLVVMIEGDAYFVVDQGSMNGSYINEERLVPGRRAEFTSFFPVRLGDDVLVSLISDEEADEMGFSDLPPPPPVSEAPQASSPAKKEIPRSFGNESTKVISLKDLQATKTEKLVKRRQDIVTKKKASPKGKKGKKVDKDKGRMQLVKIAAVVIMASAIYYNFFKESEVENTPVATETPRPTRARAQKKAEAETSVDKSLLVSDQDLVARAKMEGLIGELKCSNDLELALCDAIQGAQGESWGAIQDGKHLNVLVNGSTYKERAKAVFMPPGQNRPEPDDKSLKIITALLFLDEAVPKDFKAEKFQNMVLSFGLFDVDPEKKLNIIIAIKPEALVELKGILDPKHFENVTKFGMPAVQFAEKYFIVY